MKYLTAKAAAFQARHGGRKLYCLLRFTRCEWARMEDGRHAWKVCTDCGRKRMTHHLACPAVCWSGPAA